ncbi:MAG: hypothetical protein IKW85_06180 [Muribaculaceae bacterium]|nr:hypothetical protein [Muribaculaceae bacterium]
MPNLKKTYLAFVLAGILAFVPVLDFDGYLLAASESVPGRSGDISFLTCFFFRTLTIVCNENIDAKKNQP